MNKICLIIYNILAETQRLYH